MEQLPEWIPDGVDLDRASAARMYDYYLGGAHNFGIDRELARKALELFPDGELIARANRAFLDRAVRFMLSQGIRQFLDIGSGIPTVGNVHEVAQKADPLARVLYVDHDPVAVAHSELILRDNPGARVLQADLRRPERILDSPLFGEVIDPARPTGVLMVSVLHFVAEDDRPQDTIKAIRDAVAPGSHLAISQGTGEARQAATTKLREVYASSSSPVTYRTRERIRELFDGWELLEPGVVWLPEWRPDWTDEVGPDPASTVMAAGVAVKP